MTDAIFEDGADTPLKLLAYDQDDLAVISALLQDSVFLTREMRWDAARRRFYVLLNRPRWEDQGAAKRQGRDFERVQSVLSLSDVLKVQSVGVSKSDPDLVLSLLTLSFTAGEDGAGRIELTFAGDGAIALEVEAIDVALEDVTKPYVAVSKKAPSHNL